MFLAAFSFAALAFAAYCAISERDAGKKNYYIFLVAVMAALTTCNLFKAVVW